MKIEKFFWFALVIIGFFGAFKNRALADVSGPFEPVRFDRGIVFKAPANQAYELAMRFRMQNLAAYTTRSDKDLHAGRIDAQVRRLRLRFQGYAVDPRLTFQLQLSFSRQDQDFSATNFPNVVRDANITYEVIPAEWFISFGQGKLPGNRQRVISSGEQQFADRSIVNGTFNIDRDFGFQTLYRQSHWNIRGSLTTGEGRNLTNSSDSGLAYVGRIEALPMGEFKNFGDYFEGDLQREEKPKLSFGYSLANFQRSNRAGGTIGTVYTTSGNPQTGTPIRRSQQVHLADLLMKWNGWSFYSEWAHRSSSNGRVDATRALFEGSGILVQTAYFVSEKLELAARHARVRPYSRSVIDSSNRYTVQNTVGGTYYLKGHRVKIQSDITRQSIHQPSWIARLNFELGI